MLTYYIGQYLIPALAGKVASSFRVAEIAMYVWAEAGLFLVVFNLLCIVKAQSPCKQLFTVIILVFFSGCLLLSQQFFEILSGLAVNTSDPMYTMTSVYGNRLEYRSNLVDLRWVMPQALATWLVITLWWEHHDSIRNYVCLLLPVMLNGILSFLGLVLIAVFCALYKLIDQRMNPLNWIKEIFSLQNMACSAVIGIILIFYYAGNVFSDKGETGFSLQQLSARQYLCFVAGMFGIHALLIWKEHVHNSLFFAAIALLLILPFFSLGAYNDLVMCCSIPGMFIIMVCVLQYLFRRPQTACSGALIVLLTVGAIYPLKELRSILRTYETDILQHDISVETLAVYSNLVDEDVSAGWKYNYYSYDIEDNIFIQYIARTAWDE